MNGIEEWIEPELIKKKLPFEMCGDREMGAEGHQ
jgi:hypothetical protein